MRRRRPQSASAQGNPAPRRCFRSGVRLAWHAGSQGHHEAERITRPESAGKTKTHDKEHASRCVVYEAAESCGVACRWPFCLFSEQSWALFSAFALEAGKRLQGATRRGPRPSRPGGLSVKIIIIVQMPSFKEKIKWRAAFCRSNSAQRVPVPLFDLFS